MFFKALSSIITLFSALTFIGSVKSAPIVELDPVARDILARAAPVAPRFVIYSDKFVSGETGPPPASDVAVSTVLSCLSCYSFFRLGLQCLVGPTVIYAQLYY